MMWEKIPGSPLLQVTEGWVGLEYKANLEEKDYKMAHGASKCDCVAVFLTGFAINRHS